MVRLCIAELAANVLEHSVSQSTSDHIVITIKHLADGIGIRFSIRVEPLIRPPNLSSNPILPTAEGAVSCCSKPMPMKLTYTHDGSYNRVKFKIKSR